MAARAFASKVSGFVEYTGDFRITKMLEGWAKEDGWLTDAREPLSPRVLSGLKRVWPSVCSSPYEGVLFHAASLLAFFGVLRVSELVPGSRNDRSDRALRLENVQFSGDSMGVWICWSKTDQRQRGVLLNLGPSGFRDLCPVLALREYLVLCGPSPGVLFCHVDGSPLTRFHFWAVTKHALAALGLQWVQFGTHSFQIGAASTAAVMGYSSVDIEVETLEVVVFQALCSCVEVLGC